MLKESISLDATLQQFETVLKIEYKYNEADKVINRAIEALESAYQVHIDKDLYALQTENQLVGDNIYLLLTAIQEACKSLALYVQVNLFHKSVGISLASVNYLSFAKPDLLHGLKYLQDVDLYQKREGIVPPLTIALTNIEMCTIKRLCIIMLTLERLGIAEGVSIIAQFLYLGGLIV